MPIPASVRWTRRSDRPGDTSNRCGIEGKTTVEKTTKECMLNAARAGTVIPAFNIPHLPMMEPVVRALRDTNAFGLIQVSRIEWKKFESKSLKAVRTEYENTKDRNFTRLHLDHVPVIDEDNMRVDYRPILEEAMELGYESVMIDGSRLSLEENIDATAQMAELAHSAGIPLEAELGAVFGHEAGPLPPYDELFASGKGFTDPDEAGKFVQETHVDWLSVAIGNIHGAISEAARSQEKIAARLNIEHLDRIRKVTTVPLVLHGGSGIRRESLQAAFKHGIAKINIGAAIRRPYEKACSESIAAGRQAVYDTVVALVRKELEIEGSARVILQHARQ